MRFSRFRRLEELPGAQHPAVYRIEFACGCGDEHLGLVSHDELDWAPLGLEQETTFVNLMTSKHDSARRRAGRARRAEDQGGGVAVELLLLARGSAAARRSRRRSGCSPRASSRTASASRSLPGLRARVGEPRHARARRRAVPQRPRDRRRRRTTSRPTRARRSTRSRPSSTRRRSTSAGSTCGSALEADPSQGSSRPRAPADRLAMCAEAGGRRGRTPKVGSAVSGRLLRAGAARGGDRPRPRPAADARAAPLQGRRGSSSPYMRTKRKMPNPATPATTRETPSSSRSRARPGRCRARTRPPRAARWSLWDMAGARSVDTARDSRQRGPPRARGGTSSAERAQKKIHRAGGAFVPRTCWLSASAYGPQARLRPTRAPCSVQEGQ